MTRVCLTLAVLLFATALPVAASGERKVKAPKSGEYAGTTGKGGQILLGLTGTEIDIAAFDFPCRKTQGRTSLNGLELTKAKKGYKFRIRARGNATYEDGEPDQNASVHLRGQFGPRGRGAEGILRVQVRRCGDSGEIKWKARRRRS